MAGHIYAQYTIGDYFDKIPLTINMQILMGTKTYFWRMDERDLYQFLAIIKAY